MLRYADEIDINSDDITEILPQLSENSKIHYDYNGCLPQDDDSADCYHLPKRYLNVTF